jgi:hypothetical protein
MRLLLSSLKAISLELMISRSCSEWVASLWEVVSKHRLGQLPMMPDKSRHQSLSADPS